MGGRGDLLVPLCPLIEKQIKLNIAHVTNLMPRFHDPIFLDIDSGLKKL